MFMRDGLHFSRKGAAVLSGGLKRAMAWVMYDI